MIFIVPAGGSGARFTAQYNTPKPFIDVMENRTMLDLVLNGCPPEIPPSKRFVILNKDNYGYTEVLPPEQRDRFTPHKMQRPSGGTSETLYNFFVESQDYSDLYSEEVLISNSDNLIMSDYKAFADYCHNENAYAGMMVMRENNPAYGYIDQYPYFTKVREKQVIGDYAVAGVFWFRNAGLLFNTLREQLRKQSSLPGDLTHAGETYFTLAFNLVHNMGGKCVALEVPRSQVLAFGTPEELEYTKTILKEELKYANVS